MFDISFTELLLIFIVGLVVLGPQKLPGVARTLGRWTGQARVYMRRLSSELERETSTGEIARSLQEMKKAVQDETRAAQDVLKKLGNDESPRKPD